MTAMPQMVALFNGMGGGAAALIGLDDFRRASESASVGAAESIPIVLSCLIGSISFAGSGVAFAKLQELMPSKPVRFPAQHIVNAVILLGLAIIGVGIVATGKGSALLYLFVLGALILGVDFVLPIGGADMPVVISLLNSFTGLAAAITGFVLDNQVLIVSGALVGASGTILTQLMSKAMNRPLSNILFSGFGAAGGTIAAGPDMEGKQVRSATVEDVGVLLAYARRVIIVPGYGMAVARAQHATKELADALEARGIKVEYAIHPVAGRMPGHMNVLLAEAKVPYEQLKEMDEINGEFPQADVVLVIGANDVVNPAARNEASSPIFGMPILNVDQAQNVVVLKRSMRTGFAGIENALFYDPKTSLLFGDATESVTALIAEVKQLVPVG
jgi:NAD(P) transhydrogenase subunit beta